METKNRIEDFEKFLERVLGSDIDVFNSDLLLEGEGGLAEALDAHHWSDDFSLSQLKDLCQEYEDTLTKSIHKRDRLKILSPSILKETNASRSCERTLHQCCAVLAEEIQSLDDECLSVLDDLDAFITQISQLHHSDAFSKDERVVDEILSLNDMFFENVLSRVDLNIQNQLQAKSRGDIRPGCSTVTTKSYLENMAFTISEDQTCVPLQELRRLQDSFQLCEEERISASISVTTAEERLKVLDRQFHELNSPESLAPITSADSLLLEKQEETHKYQKEFSALQNDEIIPLVQQLSYRQGVKFLRGSCKIRVDYEQQALLTLSRLQAMSEHQQTRLEILEAALELDKYQYERARELSAAASAHLSRAAEEKIMAVAAMDVSVQEPAFSSVDGIETHADNADDCERILAALGGQDDKFAMAFPTPADVLETARRLGVAGPKAVTDRAAMFEAHRTLWSSLRRTSQHYHQTLHMMPASPGRPIGMPADLEEALQELAVAGKEADRHLEEVLQYRDAARLVAGAGAGAAQIVADFYTRPQHLQEEMEVLRGRCAAFGWRPPSTPSAQAL